MTDTFRVGFSEQLVVSTTGYPAFILGARYNLDVFFAEGKLLVNLEADPRGSTVYQDRDVLRISRRFSPEFREKFTSFGVVTVENVQSTEKGWLLTLPDNRPAVRRIVKKNKASRQLSDTRVTWEQFEIAVRTVNDFKQQEGDQVELRLHESEERPLEGVVMRSTRR